MEAPRPPEHAGARSAAFNWKLWTIVALVFGLGIGVGLSLTKQPAGAANSAPAELHSATSTQASSATLPATIALRRDAGVNRALDKPIASRVLIISIDGLRPDLIGIANTPHLHDLIARGSYTFWAQTVADPYVYTLPAHVSMLTGVNPDRHGVTWNRYIEESYSNEPTIFELAKARGLTTAMVSGKMKFVALAKPGTLDWSYLPPEEPVEDAAVAREAVKILREHQPQVMFIHFPDTDTVGHAKGWGSPEQIKAVAAADEAVGTVMATLKELKLDDATLLIVTADHGGQGLGHEAGDVRSRTIPWIVVGPHVRKDVDLTLEPSVHIQTEDTFATACIAVGIPVPAQCEGRFVPEILESRELLQSVK